MDADLARFLRDELGHAPTGSAGPWDVRGPVWLWQGSDGAPAKGAWYFLMIDGETAQAIRGTATNAAAWGSVYVEATIGNTTWRTSACAGDASSTSTRAAQLHQGSRGRYTISIPSDYSNRFPEVS